MLTITDKKQPMNNTALFVSVFLACVVEAVEATTIVLAAGTTRHWRSALLGVLAALAVLIVAVAVAGPAISLLPLAVLRLWVGGLLLVFGLQWIRKAVLRASGYKPLHDEQAIFEREAAAAATADRGARGGVKDWYAFTLSFKGVVLEGLEVVFIVLTFGTNQGNLPVAALAAGVAVVLVVILGAVVRGPLSRVPENTLKFVVGIMLTGFGIFWGAEGAGAQWPGADTALLVIVPGLAVVALGLTLGMRRFRASRATEQISVRGPAPATSVRERRPIVRRLRSFLAFWYDFIVGDDWQIAAGVALALLVTFLLSASTLSWIVMPVAVLILLPYGVRRALR
jgi:uncharacterized membrane protein